MQRRKQPLFFTNFPLRLSRKWRSYYVGGGPPRSSTSPSSSSSNHAPTPSPSSPSPSESSSSSPTRKAGLPSTSPPRLPAPLRQGSNDDDLAWFHRPGQPDPEEGLYWAAIQQLPPEPIEEELLLRSRDDHRVRHFLPGGRRILCGDVREDAHRYFECRHPPCSRMEREPKEFSICGRCQVRVKNNVDARMKWSRSPCRSRGGSS